MTPKSEGLSNLARIAVINNWEKSVKYFPNADQVKPNRRDLLIPNIFLDSFNLVVELIFFEVNISTPIEHFP